MKRCLLFAGLIMCCLAVGPMLVGGDDLRAAEGSGEAGQLTAQDIVKEADQRRAPSEPFSFDLEIVEYVANPDTGKPERDLYAGYRVFIRGEVEGKYQSLCQFTAPAEDKEKVMLLDGNVYWLYMPGTRNVMRISAAQRLSGQASSADIASVNFQYDYNGALLGEEEMLKKDCYLLELTAKNDSVAYSKMKYWVEKGSFRPIKTEFYAASGRQLKTAYYSKFIECLGMERCTLIVIVDAVNKTRKTSMTYSNWKFRELPEFWFRKGFLKNIKFEALQD